MTAPTDADLHAMERRVRTVNHTPTPAAAHWYGADVPILIAALREARAQFAVAETRTHWDPVFTHQMESCECCTQVELLAMREDGRGLPGNPPRRPRRRAAMAPAPDALERAP
jgi:hypothetical protein